MKSLLAPLAALALAFAGPAHAATVLSAESGAPGGSTHVPMVAFAKTVSDAGVAEIQVTDGNTLTKTLVALATGKLDMGIVPIGAYNLLRHGIGPYKRLGKEKSAALMAEMRALFGYQAGYYTLVTFADTGIDSWDDLAGKRVIVGPPSGAASNITIALIDAATGYQPGEDYEAIKMGWGAVQQAFTDRKADAMMRPGPWPSALLAQLAATAELRILGMPARVYEGAVAKRAGLEPTRVDPAQMGEGAYTFSGKNDDGTVNMMSYQMSLSVNQAMDAELVYGMTKAFFERYDDAMKAAAWMPNLQIDRVVTGLASVGVKLHPGALRYYDEAGIAIPSELR